jgi:P27 family predicted phage terminase small subunit
MAKKSALHKKIKGYLGDHYQESDEQLIQLYCDTVKQYSEMKKELEQSGHLIKYTTKTGAVNLVRNPLSTELTRLISTQNRLLKALGLSPEARRIKIKDEEEDEFERF